MEYLDCDNNGQECTLPRQRFHPALFSVFGSGGITCVCIQPGQKCSQLSRDQKAVNQGD